MLFHGFDLITLIIYFDALIVSELASGSLFKLASVFFWHVPIIFFFFFLVFP